MFQSQTKLTANEDENIMMNLNQRLFSQTVALWSHVISFPQSASPPFSPRDKRVITLDTIYTRGRGLPLPFHQYQHLKFIKL